MTSSLEIDHKEMFDIRTAAASTGYSRDHIASLARAKKIVAAQVGRQWFVDLDSLKQYVEITAIEQHVKQKHLSEDRKSAREITERLEITKKRKSENLKKKNKEVKSSAVAVAGLALLMIVGLTYGAPKIMPMQQIASTKAGVENQQDTTPIHLTETAVMEKDVLPVSTVFSDGSVEVHQLARADEGVLLLPAGAANSERMFSDDVEFVTASSGQRFVVPSGGDIGEGIAVEVVTVTENYLP